MLVQLKEYALTREKHTLYLLFIDSNFRCYAMGDTPANRPAHGTYWLVLRYSPKFSDKYNHDLLWLTGCDIDNRYVLIHMGNYPDDTDACILPGMGVNLVHSPTMITYSARAYHPLYNDISAEIKRIGPVPLVISSVKVT